MTEWITDRLPTEADADIDGDVCIDENDEYFVHWQVVRPGEAWKASGYSKKVDLRKFGEQSILTTGSRWITTRQPLASDGNKDGAVRVRNYPDREWGANIHWSYVSTGVPWQHTNDFEGLIVEPIPLEDSEWKAVQEAASEPGRTFVSVQRTYIKRAKAHFLDAVASDGTAWWRYVDESGSDTHWIRCRDLPQDQ